jgi:hypothetical protein
MKPRYDIRLNKAFINAKNDIEWYESDITHIRRIISANVGEYKENPTMGIGIRKYLSSSGTENELKRKTMIEMQRDMYPCDNPIVTLDATGKLELNPNIVL